MPRSSLILAFCLLAMPASPQAADGVVGRFDPAVDTPPAPWQELRFDDDIPPTRYRVTPWDGAAAVEAVADASMSLLARPLAIDLARTPVLCWRWRIDGVVASADMATRAGDDYAARVYVAFALPPESLDAATRGGLALAQMLYGREVPDGALNYVWDNRHPIGTQQANSYTDQARMIVLRSGNAEAGTWVEERRDVLRDATAAFGTDRAQATLLALGTDTDNTGERARAGFADLHFVARDAACAFQNTEN
jgi:hypothetical protein